MQLGFDSGEIDDFTNSQNNEERKYFNSLVTLMEKELSQVEKKTTLKGPKVNLIEVFCSDQKYVDRTGESARWKSPPLWFEPRRSTAV